VKVYEGGIELLKSCDFESVFTLVKLVVSLLDFLVTLRGNVEAIFRVIDKEQMEENQILGSKLDSCSCLKIKA
jgi:hypothetical protein